MNLSFSMEIFSIESVLRDPSLRMIQNELLRDGNNSYFFESNKSLLECKLDVCENSFITTYHELIMIELDEMSRAEVLIIDAVHGCESLGLISMRFDVINYSIQIL